MGSSVGSGGACLLEWDVVGRRGNVRELGDWGQLVVWCVSSKRAGWVWGVGWDHPERFLSMVSRGGTLYGLATFNSVYLIGNFGCRFCPSW